MKPHGYPLICLLSFFSLFSLCMAPHKASAVDELFLCGIVKTIDTKTGMVTVDVQSGSCPGVRKFQLAAPDATSNFIAGEEKCFPIDSSYCNDNKIHKIVIKE